MSKIRKAIKIAGGVGLASMVVRRVVKKVRRKRRRKKKLEAKVGREALVGKMCRVRSHEVTDAFGAASCKVGGHSLNIDVRCLFPNGLTGGSVAKIVAYHEGSDTYEVIPPAATRG